MKKELTLTEAIELAEKVAQQGPWFPACGGTEVPFKTTSGHRVLYMFQPSTRSHAYFDLDSDMQIFPEMEKAYGLCA